MRPTLVLPCRRDLHVARHRVPLPGCGGATCSRDVGMDSRHTFRARARNRFGTDNLAVGRPLVVLGGLSDVRD